MDTQMWGPLVWDTLAVIARACDDLPPDPPELEPDWQRYNVVDLVPDSRHRWSRHPQAASDHRADLEPGSFDLAPVLGGMEQSGAWLGPCRGSGPRATAVRAFVMLTHALRHVLPCIFCRTSFGHYIEVTPPDEFVHGSHEAACIRAAGRYAEAPLASPHCCRVQNTCVRNVLARPTERRAPDHYALEPWCRANGIERGAADDLATFGFDASAVAAVGSRAGGGLPMCAMGTLDAHVQSRGTLIDWVWVMHNRVNSKLGVTNMITRRRFRKRLRVTSFLVHPSAIWDLLTIVALNFPPELQPNGAPTTTTTAYHSVPPQGQTLHQQAAARSPEAQRHEKCAAHAVFLQAFAVLLPLVPDLGSIAPYIDPNRAMASCALASRTPFVQWIRYEKRRWMRDMNVDRAVCHRMLASEAAYAASVA